MSASLGLDGDIVQTKAALRRELEAIQAQVALMLAELACDDCSPKRLQVLWEGVKFSPRIGVSAELGRLQAWMAARSMIAATEAPLPAMAWPRARTGEEHPRWRDGDRYDGKSLAAGALAEADRD